MAFEELLEWAGTRYPWQQDALRRIALQGEITEDDLSELRAQIEQSAGLRAEGSSEASPLTGDHLAAAADDAPATVLAALGPVENVDRLEPGQPSLRFAVNGVTLIYGANGCGKSGYCRIAKQLCRSLSPGKLRGNVYSDAPAGPPRVCVAFRVGDDGEKVDRTWEIDQPPPLELARISVFDSATARVYVDQERKIEFLPYELDIMNKLGLTCRTLDNSFRERETALDRTIAVPLPTGFSEDTSVTRLIARLVPQTPLPQLPTEDDIRALGKWSDEKQAELQDLTEQLEGDPRRLAQVRRRGKRALETVKETLTGIALRLTDGAIADFRAKKDVAVEKNRAAEAAARDLFSKQPIPDLGSETWREMLKYAREFAESVFVGKKSPQLATGGLCVLCQQELGDDAASRLTEFDDYIAGRIAADSDAAAKAFEDAKAEILALRILKKAAAEAILSAYSSLGEETATHATAIVTFFEKAGQRLEAVKTALQEEEFERLGRLEALPASPAPLLENEIARLEAEAVELEKKERDEEALAALKLRVAELTDQKKLNEQVETFVHRRNQLEERCRLATCRGECRLTAITRRITDRRRQILTPTLKSALDDEIKALKLTHIPLNLSDRGDGAESILEVALNAQQRIRANSEVLSEGEQRALALACFLAELSEIGANHGIIVDDPVSSLDHTRMEAVARRLAEEAGKGRQVIVFTHNIVFHHMLLSEARRANVARHTEWMSSAGQDRFGLIDEAQKPWQMKKVGERLHEIEAEIQALKAAAYDPSDQSFRPSIVAIYTKMRETWERVVEDVLLNGAVQRFRPEVMTQRLEEACFDAKADYPAIFEGMKRCSHYSGHDTAADLPPELPDEDGIQQDLAELRTFCEAAAKRQKELRKERKHEEGVEPELL
ncbi:AAA family ATPase [Hyphomicrobium sp.]|uniref:AAA family ATPase n=1 Tax=Hyphomicrobium sp. TaxID=82 RepID=UPI000FBEB984|nr:AAA family ATPase [Hyphomicrobium sp.]RUP07741.1 MAG: hypothetical protein EKK38_19460 [Hyphomicrobium sp.]